MIGYVGKTGWANKIGSVSKIAQAGKIGLAVTVLGLSACGDKDTVILQGERLTLRTNQTEQEIANVNRSKAISLGAAVSRTSWTHAGGSATHNAGHNAFSATPSVAWTQSIGDGNSRKHRIASAPVAANGLIAAFDSNATVTVVSAASGTPIWSRNLTPVNEKRGEASGGSLAISGNVLIASTAFGEVIAFDLATGAEHWRQDIDAVGASGVTVLDGLVYVIGGDSQLWTISIADGLVQWQISGFDVTASRVGAAAPAVTNRLAVVPFASGDIYGVFRKGGTQLWTSSLSGKRSGVVYANVSDVTADPVIVGNTAYIGNQSGRFGAFNIETGVRLWTANEGAYSHAAVVGGSAFIVTDRGELVRLAASSGERVWGKQLPFFTEEKTRKRKAVFAHYGPVAAGGKIWVASSDGYLRSFTPENGALSAQIELPAPAASDPIFVGGVMYVLLETGELAALQ
jgi:outer membrane protein assembly factor BamB